MLTVEQPKWYSLKSSRKGKRQSQVSGDIQIQFSLLDPNNRDATPQQIFTKFTGIAGQADAELDEMEDLTLTRTETDDMDNDDTDAALDEGEDTEEPETSDAAQKKRRKIRLAKMRKKAKQRAFELSGSSDIAVVLFLEVSKIIDLPPEKNSQPPQTCNRYPDNEC